jgi:type I restriction enzyme, S subunit
MSKKDLPDGWTLVKFGDVARQIKDAVDPETSDLDRYVAGGHMDTDDLKIRRWGLVGDGYLGPAFHRRFQQGHILYGSRRTYLRKVAVADFDGICANTTFVIEARPEKIHPALLPFIMQSEPFVIHSIKNSRGSTNPYVNWKDIARYEFALPSLAEQGRIAEVLTAVEENIEYWKIVQQNLETSRRLLMRDVFDTDALKLLDSKLQAIRLGKIVEYASDGPFGSKLKTSHYRESGARVIRLQNIGERFFDNEDKAYISSEYFEQDLQRYAVHPGDILIAGLGDDSNPVGRSCLAPEYISPAVNKADCFCVRPKAGVLDSNYLLYWLNSSYGQKQVLRLAQGTTRLRINVTNLQTILIPVPNLQVQKTIATIFQEIDCKQLEIAHQIEQTQLVGKQLLQEFLELP